MREAAELEVREPGLDGQSIRDRSPREAALDLLADRAAAPAGGVAPARRDTLIARLREEHPAVRERRLPAGLRGQVEPQARRVDVAPRDRAVDVRRSEVEAARAEQRVETLDRRVARVLVATRVVVSQEQGRAHARVERKTGFQMDEVGVLLEVAPSDAVERAASATPFPNGLGLVAPAAGGFGYAIGACAGGRPMRRHGEVAARRLDVVVEQIGLDVALVRERRDMGDTAT